MLNRSRFLNHEDRENVSEDCNRRQVCGDETAVTENRFRKPSDDQDERCQPKSNSNLAFIHALASRPGAGKVRLAALATL